MYFSQIAQIDTLIEEDDEKAIRKRLSRNSALRNKKSEIEKNLDEVKTYSVKDAQLVNEINAATYYVIAHPKENSEHYKNMANQIKHEKTV